MDHLNSHQSFHFFDPPKRSKLQMLDLAFGGAIIYTVANGKDGSVSLTIKDLPHWAQVPFIRWVAARRESYLTDEDEEELALELGMQILEAIAELPDGAPIPPQLAEPYERWQCYSQDLIVD